MRVQCRPPACWSLNFMIARRAMKAITRNPQSLAIRTSRAIANGGFNLDLSDGVDERDAAFRRR